MSERSESGESAKAVFRVILIVVVVAASGAFLGKYVLKRFPVLPHRLLKPGRSLPLESGHGSQNPVAPANPIQSSSDRDSYGYPRQRVDKVALLALLRARKYQELTNQIESYQKEFEDDFRNELKITDAFESFSIVDRSIEPLLNEWVASSSQSFAPYLARAEYFTAQGWESRGGNYAGETSEKRFEGMRDYFSLADKDIRKAMKLRTNLVEAYCVLIDMAMANGEEAEADRLASEALGRMPLSFEIRAAYITSLEPRWRGSYEEMEAFATESQKLLSRNPKFRILRGWMDLDKGHYLLNEKQYEEALSAFNEAMKYGDHCILFDYRAAALIHLNRNQEALEDYNRAIADDPQRIKYRTARAQVLCQLNRFAEAIQDLELAARLDPASSKLAKSRRFAASTVASAGYQLYEARNLNEAIAMCDQAITIDPMLADGYYYRAFARRDLNRKNLSEAILQDLKKACELGNQDACRIHQQVSKSRP